MDSVPGTQYKYNGDRFGYLTRKQLEEHPDWNAMMGGKRSINGRFCWANPEVSDAVAASISEMPFPTGTVHVEFRYCLRPWRLN